MAPVWSILFGNEEPCVPCTPREDLPPDSSLRDKAAASIAPSPYGVALKKQDEANGLFLDEDVYLFAGDPGYKTRTIYRKYWMPASCVVLGGGAHICSRVLSKLPVMAKGTIWKLPLTVVVSWVVGRKLQDHIDDYTAERDAQFLHYCRLHPEDFPRREKVLFRDYLTPWFPIR